MLPTFQYFGSADSKDLDIVFFVHKIPTSIAECAAKCAFWSDIYQTLFPTDKTINSNLAVVEKGVLRDSFKGNMDELNNSLFCTYDLHVQPYPNSIQKCFVRDVDLKFLRAARSVLSHLTKTQHRTMVKEALKGTIQLKFNVLEQIHLKDLDWSNTRLDLLEIKKALAFQMGQTLALQAGSELYTKKEISTLYPTLKPYLDRQPETDFKDLQIVLTQFAQALKVQMHTMQAEYEYKYKITQVVQ